MVYLSILLIRFYRLIAPSRVRGACRFDPTCSEYAIQALEKYGFVKGWKMTVGRLRRCRPPYGGTDCP